MFPAIVTHNGESANGSAGELSYGYSVNTKYFQDIRISS